MTNPEARPNTHSRREAPPARPQPSLDAIKIASPCSASWDQMSGSETVRFCGDCQLDVYNVSQMTAEESQALLEQQGQGRLCVRLYRRADGTVLTQDCPKGLAILRAKLTRARRRVTAACSVFFAFALGCDRPKPKIDAEEPPVTVETPTEPEVLMGAICPPDLDPDPILEQGEMIAEPSHDEIAPEGK